MKVDFHCHTTASDGSLSPIEIVDLALKHEVTSLAITDHDTTSGYQQALNYAQKNQLQLITGVEASCSWNKHTIHVVGLDFDIENKLLQDGLKELRKLRLERAESMLIKLNSKLGSEITDLENKLWNLVDKGVVGRGHFAQLLTEQGLVKNNQQAFKKYLMKGKPGYAAIEWPDISEVVGWITQAGGVAVLAHPGIYKISSNKLNRLIEDFASAGGQAIEVVNQPRHGAEITGMADRAERYNLHASLGSDFHRPEQTWRGLGWLAPLPLKSKPVWELFKTPICSQT
jgi:predicted metal-dependent phosphoesterase TrpH